MRISVTQTVNVDLKPEAFTDAFMEEFRGSFFPFYDVEEHAQYIAQMIARGVYGEVQKGLPKTEFFEGYGPIGEFVNSATIESTEIETQ